jgi:tripartite-type tricarboxylate transporter receptor subunit TctC
VSKVRWFVPRVALAFGAVAALVGSSLTVAVHAQSTANQISLVVPYAPGGPSDSSARLLRPVLERVLGKTVIVENAPGAGGSIGAAKVLRATDGSQILLGTPNEPILAPIGLAAVKFKADEFRLVGTFGELPFALVTRADFPAKNVDELVNFSRANPGKALAYGSMGAGSINHLATESMQAATGTNLNHVPYRGAAPLIQDLLGGQIDFAFTPLVGNLFGLIDTGKVKFLGTTSTKRVARFKDAPTVNEGRALKDFVYGIWFGLLVSKATPEPVVQKIRDSVVEALRDPDIRRGLGELGFVEFALTTAAETDKFYSAEALKYRKVADSIKLQPQ